MRSEDEWAVEFLDEGDGGAEPAAPDVLEVRPRVVRRRWVSLGLVVVAAVGGGFALRGDNGRSPAAAPPTSSTPPPTSPAAVPTEGADVPAASLAPTVVDVGHPLLGEARWELFGMGPGRVVRIQPALGRVWTTPLPPLRSSGPVSFVVTEDGVLVRPIDYVPGYAVRDGEPAVELSEPLRGGPLFPGPASRPSGGPATGRARSNSS